MQAWLRKIGSWFVKGSRIAWDAATAFSRNNDYLKASALTFYTLISIVPFLAVAFGIATGFGFEQYLENELKQAFEEQEDVIIYAIKFAHSLLQNTKGSVLAGVGVIALLWTNLSMLGSIENALNDIWRVRQPRSWAKKITDYLAVMIICPLFFVVSSSVSVYLITQITVTAKESRIVEIVSPFLLLLLKLVPFFLSISLFIVIYMFIPNVRIRARPRIIAGILAGIAFQLWQWVYIKFQVEISSYGVVYGTFAALPLFLVWLQVSWLIVLGGAELAAQIENDVSSGRNERNASFNKATPKQLGLLILCKCIKAFSRGEPPPTAFELARDISIPLLSAQQMIDILEDGGVLVEVGIKGDTRIGYQPSRDARLFTIKSVCDAIEKQISVITPIKSSETLHQISEYLDEFDRILDTSQANINLSQLISDKS